jgi:hypothetical protein
VLLLSVAALEAVGQEHAAVTREDPARYQALAALEEVIKESQKYEDQSLRVRVKARVADVLWPLEPARGRELAANAFEEAGSLKGDIAARYRLRAEITAVARRHDPDWAAQLIARFEESAEDAGRLSRDSLEQISERGALYLDSARDFLREGEQERALDFARRSFTEGRSAQFIWFLNDLRARDAAAADKFFLEAVKALVPGRSGPNDVLLLGLYLFFPGSVAVGTLDGVEAVSYGVSFGAAPAVPPTLARPYLRAAADVLLRFPATPGQPGPTGSVALKRFALTQLMPLYVRYEPQLVGELATALTGLGPYTAPPASSESPAVFEKWVSAADSISKIERLRDARERDHYFFAALRSAISAGDFAGAREVAARIGETELKEASLELVGFNEARAAVKRDDLEAASRIASGQLTRERRAVIYFQLAEAWQARGDFARASQETEAALAEAAKTAEPEQRARTYIFLAAGLAERNGPRAFELLEAAAGDLRDARQFDVADERLVFKIRTPVKASFDIELSRGVGLLSAVPHLARADFNRTLGIARSLGPPESRALAVIAACRVVLAPAEQPPHKKKPGPPAKFAGG